MLTDFTRYSKNLGAFTRDEIELIHTKSVCVTGCGGLGGYAAMTLARFGLRKLTLVDGDVFTVSNLNRQLFCTEKNIGKNKAAEAQTALSIINSEMEIKIFSHMLNEDNYSSILSGHDAVIDCLDNIPARILLEKGCNEAQIPLVHGAINGFYGQLCSVFPGDNTLSMLYAENTSAAQDSNGGNPPFTPQLIAAMQCSEVLKLLCGRKNLLRKKLLLIDMEHNSFQTIDL